MVDRRSLLSWMGASVAGGLHSRSGNAAQPSNSVGVIALENFHVAHAEQMPRLHRYLGEALLPLTNEILNRPAICLEALIAPESPQALVLTAFSSFDEMLATRGRIAAQRPIQLTRAELESSGLLTDVRSQVLIGAQEALRFPADSEFLNSMIFELRSYYCPTWQVGPPSLVKAALDRAGIHPIVSAAFATGEHIPQFTYLIPFDSLSARQEAWSRLATDPDWSTIERESAKNGFAVKVTAKSIYKLGPYSRLA